MSISNKTATNAFIFNIIIRYQFLILDIISNNINNSSESVVFLEDFKKKE